MKSCAPRVLEMAHAPIANVHRANQLSNHSLAQVIVKGMPRQIAIHPKIRKSLKFGRRFCSAERRHANPAIKSATDATKPMKAGQSVCRMETPAKELDISNFPGDSRGLYEELQLQRS